MNVCVVAGAKVAPLFDCTSFFCCFFDVIFTWFRKLLEGWDLGMDYFTEIHRDKGRHAEGCRVFRKGRLENEMAALTRDTK